MQKLMLVLLLASVTATAAAGQARTNYAEAWGNIPLNVRAWYVGGYEDGLLHGATFAWMLSGTTPDVRFAEELRNAKLTSQQKTALSAATRTWVRMGDPGPYGTRVVAETMTQLYADPANSFIPYHEILRVALMRLQGVSREDVDRWLEILRATSQPR